jgi:hypothetical protein
MEQILIAAQFLGFMNTGRTKPAILGCEDDSGKWAGDYVVKLIGGLETAESGLLCELLGSKVAAYFGLPTPEPAIIRIEKDLAELIAQAEPEHSARIRKSVGLNFGSKLMTGFATWPTDKSIPEAMRPAAVKIFAFDALIQNPDRRYGNPNLFAKGDTVFVYDHEMAFSFLLDLRRSAAPWKLGDQGYLSDHVFFTALRSKTCDLEGFTKSLAALSERQITMMTANVPREWNNGSLTRIEEHLRLVGEHAEEFAEEVKRRLV